MLACALLSFVWALGADVARAQPKGGKIAILGLEVEDKSGQPITEEATKLAKDLTRALRMRVDASQQPYALAANSDKELLDEKLMNGCNDEAPPCMAKIAGNMSADALAWGKLEKGKNPNNKTEDGYKVTLTLLKVATKQAATHTAFLTLGQKSEAGLKTFAKDAYAALVKDDAQGKLVIKANVDNGKILVDGINEVGTINNKRGEVSLAEGTYKLSVQADGYKPFELGELQIEVGKTMTRDANLEKIDNLIDRGGTASTRKSYTGWKIAAGAGFAIAAGGTAWLLSLKFGDIDAYENLDQGAYVSDPKNALGSDNCSQKDDALMGPAKEFKAACNAYRNSYIAAGVIGVGAVIGFGSLFYVLTRDSATTTERSAGRRTKKRPPIAITPIISPSNAGATIRIDW